MSLTLFLDPLSINLPCSLLAGEINWNAHITSSAHFENVKKAAAIPSKTLHWFFNEKATSSPFEAPRSLSTLDPFAHLHR